MAHAERPSRVFRSDLEGEGLTLSSPDSFERPRRVSGGRQMVKVTLTKIYVTYRLDDCYLLRRALTHTWT